MKRTFKITILSFLAVIIAGIFTFSWIRTSHLTDQEIINKRMFIDHSLGKDSQNIIVFFPDGLKNLEVLQPVRILIPESTNAEVAAIDELITGFPKLKLKVDFPIGTKLLNITKREDIYTVNFSNEFLNIQGGRSRINGIITSLVYTLTEFPNTKGVQILVNNEPALLPEGVVNDKPFTREDVKSLFKVGSLKP